jgi:glutathione S-transferase
MKLLFNAASPFARKVRIALLEKRLIDQVHLETVQPWPEPFAITPFNPLGKIPVLILDDGSALYDSPVICEYIDTLSEEPRLIALGGASRLRTLRLQALADGALDAAVNIVLERKRAPAERSDNMLTRWTQAISRSLDHFAADLGRRGQPFDLGEISLACLIGYLAFRLPDLGLVSDSRLQEWWQATSRRDSVLATDPALGGFGKPA